MAENIITNANDVEIVMEGEAGQSGTSQSLGRMVVDDFSITREEDVQSVSSVGMQLPAGLSNGDITFNFSFTMMGEDRAVFDNVATSDGKSRIFSFTARKIDDNGNTTFEFALKTCKASSEEISGSTGDPMEYAVEGIAVSMERL